MERMTYKTEAGWQVPEGQLEEALERLARFEDAYEAILADQEALTAKLEPLKAAGKQKSAQFRELLGQKLVNQQILIRLEYAGIS